MSFVGKEQYRISLLAPVIGMCIEDVHCLSTVLVPADVSGYACIPVALPLSLYSLVPMQIWNDPQSICPIRNQPSSLDFGLIVAVLLRSDNH